MSTTSEKCQQKLSFDSKKAAMTAATVASFQHHRGEKTKLKAYQCKSCQLWHLATKWLA
ncbi:hypothetical protein IPO96_03495 [Candidatus Saccharibacteria bacterium]|nr:MAG: hypothetical protein IPO96_03495 [Candidatus Saccharibacteria bacterium]